ncbi:hypothetical protein L195_g059450, partial [Trifolium pratense]
RVGLASASGLSLKHSWLNSSVGAESKTLVAKVKTEKNVSSAALRRFLRGHCTWNKACSTLDA